jgi:release factor glutamine methyltransferase
MPNSARLPPKSVGDALICQRRLINVSSSPRLDCELLLMHAMSQTRSWLLTHDDQQLTPAEADLFGSLLSRREAGEPIAYLLGTQGFWDMDLLVSPATLIPRPETELLVDILLEALPPTQQLKLVDLGTGTGAIALALARERPVWQIHATDRHAATLSIAANNIRRWSPGKVLLVQADWLAAFGPASFDVIVANPPYIHPDDPHLPDLKFEPSTALVADKEGLGDLQQIIAAARRCLKPNGLLLMEHGFDQQETLMMTLQQHGFVGIQPFADLNHQPRAVLARLEKPELENLEPANNEPTNVATPAETLT